MELPWSDLKVAFDTHHWHDDVFDYFEREEIKRKLPEGWELDGASGDGARSVVIFRVVDKLPTIEDGETILKILDSSPRE